VAGVRRAFFQQFWEREVIPALGGTADGDLHLRIDARAGLPRGAEDGYRLRLDDALTLKARTEQGAWYGLQTLRQIAQGATRAGHVPLLVIRDWPRTRWRIFQVDLARHMAYRPAFFARLCRELSALKFNALQLYLEHNFIWDAYPEVAEVDALTKEQVPELEATAAEYGITVIPAINLCRHMEGFLVHPRLAHLKEMPLTRYPVPGGQLRLSHPEAWDLVRTLLDETLEAFSGPFIHLGMDETHYIGRHPATEKKTPGQWLGGHIARCCEYVRRRGRRPIVWGDKFLDPRKFEGKDVANCTGICPYDITRALEYVPKDCIINDWHYTSSGDASVRFFRRKGYEVWAAPSIRSGQHFLDPAQLEVMPAFVANAVQAGAAGAMLTTWGWYGGFRIDDHRFSIALFADTAWTGEKPELDDFERRWSRLRYGRRLPLMATLRSIAGPPVRAFDELLASAGKSERRSWGASVRTELLWKDANPFDVAARFGQPDYRSVQRAQRTLGQARRAIERIAARAARHGEELAAWGYYVDLYQHLLDRLTLTAELIVDYHAGTAKMLPEPMRWKDRKVLFRSMRERLERLYQQALGFLRIQRRLYAEVGSPLQDLEHIQRHLRGLAETMLMLRRAEETGDTPDTDALFGKAGLHPYTPYRRPIERP